MFILYQRVPNLIGGAFVDSQSSASIDVINPVSVSNNVNLLFFQFQY